MSADLEENNFKQHVLMKKCGGTNNDPVSVINDNFGVKKLDEEAGQFFDTTIDTLNRSGQLYEGFVLQRKDTRLNEHILICIAYDLYLVYIMLIDFGARSVL